MNSINTSIADVRKYPSQRSSGADAKLHLHNTTDRVLERGEVNISVESPEGVNTDIGMSIQKENDTWELVEPLRPDRDLILPVFIRLEPWKKELQGSIMIQVDVHGECVKKATFQVLR
ncbi:hypothetical protein [Halorientalis brevis]